MIEWFKKDPLIHGIFVLLLIPSIIIFSFLGLVIYSTIHLFDPNYVEFGPRIGLYKAKDCAEIDRSLADGQCLIARWMEGMYKNSTKTLDRLLKSAVNQKEGLFKPSSILDGYPKNGTEWSCSTKGQLILDNTVEIIQPVLYKCWPK